MSLIALPPYRSLVSGAATDPPFSQVQVLLHFEGTNGSAGFTDVKGHSITSSLVTHTTSNPLFGTSSGSFPGSTSQSFIINGATSPGTTDFTMECFVKLTSTDARIFVDCRPGANGGYLTFYGSDTNIRLHQNSLDVMSGNYPSILNVRTHIALSRSGDKSRLFVNGIKVTERTYTGGYVAPNIGIGCNQYNAGNPLLGLMDEFRYTLGTGLYVENFIPPTAAFPNS